MASPLPLEELWRSALVNYGLERPSENTEIQRLSSDSADVPR